MKTANDFYASHRFPSPDRPDDNPAPEVPVPEHENPSDPIPHQVPGEDEPSGEPL
jgi:hypothetical protein